MRGCEVRGLEVRGCEVRGCEVRGCEVQGREVRGDEKGRDRVMEGGAAARSRKGNRAGALPTTRIAERARHRRRVAPSGL